MSNVHSMGWVPDLEDHRDLTPASPQVRSLLAKLGAPVLPSKVDLRTVQPFPPVFSQGQPQSCTACASSALLEYFELRSFKKYIPVSKLFLYKATRNLLNTIEDKGAFNRSAMQALVMVGAPPEQYWPYDVQNLNVEPPAFLYALAQNYKAKRYYRYDNVGSDYGAVLQQIKTNLAALIPAVFGFYVFPSINSAVAGAVPFPSLAEQAGQPLGGHAVLAIGYDDAMTIRHPSGDVSTGALLFRNSWGPGWGDAGYGWLPYQYVLSQLATDWWSLIAADYIDTGGFGYSQMSSSNAPAAGTSTGEPTEVEPIVPPAGNHSPGDLPSGGQP